MADLVIRGMELPKTCGDCVFSRIRMDCRLTGKDISRDWVNRKIPDSCPLIPLPERHGRLIDGDVLLEQIRDGFEKAEKWRDAVENDPEIRPRAEATVVAFWECGAKVKMAPTIVPAEGGTDNGN